MEDVAPKNNLRTKTTTKTTASAKKLLSFPQMQDQLTGAFTSIGVLVSVADSYDGQVIIKGAEPLAESLTELAKQNPRVRSSLNTMLAVTGWSAVIAAASQIALPIAAHHGLIPDIFGGKEERSEDSPVAGTYGGVRMAPV